MTSISEMSWESPSYREWLEPKETIQLQIFSEPCPMELIVEQIASIEEPISVYVWYEGPRSLPKSGALFMKEQFFEPLYRLKQNAKLYLYSLKGWDFHKTIIDMPYSTPLGKAINRINTVAIECIYSSSFFRYCTESSKESGLCAYINEALPQKKWLLTLSDTQKKSGVTIKDFFNDQPSLFDCVKDMDLSSAYSLMQYVEGYYLIQESVKKGLSNEQKKIKIAFVLPNDESKYYVDLPKDIKNMLLLDFGKDITGVDINITFWFFSYGTSLSARPYIDKNPQALKVGSKEVESYFDYLSEPSFPIKQLAMPFLKDVIHNLNGWC